MEESTEKLVEEKGKRLSTTEWAEICSLWEIGDVTLEFLSNKYGVTKEAIWRGLKRREVKKGSRAEAHRNNIANRVAEEAATNVNELAKRIKSTKDDYYKHAEAITKIAMNELIKAVQDKRPIQSCNPAITALNDLMKLLRGGLDVRWKVLELDKEGVSEDELPELVIRELTTDEIDQINITQTQDEYLLGSDEDDEIIENGDVITGDEDEDNG